MNIDLTLLALGLSGISLGISLVAVLCILLELRAMAKAEREAFTVKDDEGERLVSMQEWRSKYPWLDP